MVGGENFTHIPPNTQPCLGTLPSHSSKHCLCHSFLDVRRMIQKYVFIVSCSRFWFLSPNIYYVQYHYTTELHKSCTYMEALLPWHNGWGMHLLGWPCRSGFTPQLALIKSSLILHMHQRSSQKAEILCNLWKHEKMSERFWWIELGKRKHSELQD